MYRRYLKSSARRIDMLTVAMSTGVSAAFGTPFGGVVFAVEVVSQYFYVPNLRHPDFCVMFFILY